MKECIYKQWKHGTKTIQRLITEYGLMKVCGSLKQHGIKVRICDGRLQRLNDWTYNKSFWQYISNKPLKINLPTFIEFSDYHDISDFHNKLKQLIPGVKCKEVTPENGYYDYIGFFYSGRLSSSRNRQALSKFKQTHQ